MTSNLIEFLIVLIGLAATAFLFYRFPTMPEIKDDGKRFPTVSVIIPARNEEKNLPLLLEDLRGQTLAAYEIICADDASEDSTAHIAQSYGVRVVSLPDKPEGWTGKTWACQNGANVAKGELLLFLDADVRLGRNGLRKLMQAYTNSGCTISVQPYHKTEKIYEQFSMFFNLIQIAANGTALPKALNIGLFGPIIFIAHADYIKAGGHESTRKSVIEDMALGMRLRKTGLPYRLFVGDEELSFRMYSGGLRSLLQGWVKNLAAGAAKTPFFVFLMVFFWIASLTSVPLHLIKYAVAANAPWLIIYSLLYIAWVSLLAVLTRRVGHFHLWSVIFYPLLIPVLLGVFTVSIIKKVFRLKVTWKGRAIISEEKT